VSTEEDGRESARGNVNGRMVEFEECWDGGWAGGGGGGVNSRVFSRRSVASVTPEHTDTQTHRSDKEGYAKNDSHGKSVLSETNEVEFSRKFSSPLNMLCTRL